MVLTICLLLWVYILHQHSLCGHLKRRLRPFAPQQVWLSFGIGLILFFFTALKVWEYLLGAVQQLMRRGVNIANVLPESIEKGGQGT